MGTLYEYLREARLEQFYPAFRANGITRSESLINLGMPEFFALGITSSEDKRRLIELVNIIKSVHDSSSLGTHSTQRRTSGSRQSHVSNLNLANSTPESSTNLTKKTHHTRNQNSPSSRVAVNREGAAQTVQHLEPSRDVIVQDRVSSYSLGSYLGLLRQVSESSDSDVAIEHSNDDRTPHRNVSSPTTLRTPVQKGSAIERIKHSKNNSYNYGVHKVSTPTKTRSSRSESHRSFGEEKIKVCVRKRPLTKREQRTKDEDIVHTESTNTLIVNEPKLALDLQAYTLQHEFIFDEVFEESCTNEDVYIRAARPLISCIFNGGTATCFAYGQTGAGKTHTMLGGEDAPGLYLLAGRDIFSIIQSGTYGRGLHVWVSFFEIYCGQLFDLLNRRNRLQAREDGSHQVCIAGLTETEATSVSSMVQILDYGNSVRSKGASGVNPDSSRSHAVLQLDIRNEEDSKVGKISFIDLAGSERASDVTDTDKQTRMEGAEINQSLLALKECIRSIDQDSRHTPFRQSKLTHILKDSFVGNSRTCMIANISPTQTACENTLNTLRYADRVKELKRDSTRGSSVGQAMNLLMNIPPTAPSIFHPSNILSSSTPMRASSHSQRERVTVPSLTFIDPTETPIRGHHMQRRQKESTRNKHDQSSYSQAAGLQWKTEQMNGVSSNPSVPAALSSRSSTHAIAASQGTSAPPPDASPSESDQTDTDSCNVTHPTVTAAGILARQMQVAKSTDTEYDYPTSDFNNIDEINDLNRSSELLRGQSLPKQKESRLSSQLSSRDQAISAASAPDMVLASVVSSSTRAPVLRPVMYRAAYPEPVDAADGQFAQENQISEIAQKFQTAAELASLNVSRQPSSSKKIPVNKVDTSDDSVDDEDLLSDWPGTQTTLQVMNNLDTPSASLAGLKPNPVSFINKDLLIPLPGNSGDLSFFTQRANLRPTEPFNAAGIHIPPAQAASSSTAFSVGGAIAQLEELSLKVSSTHSRVKPPSSVPTPPPAKQLQSPDGKLFSKETHPIPHNISYSSSRQLPQPRGLSPSSDQPNTGSAFTAPPRTNSPNKSSEDSLQGSNAQCLSDISDSGSHQKALSSPTGEGSGDSLDSVRASLSDQGHGGHQSHSRSSMRKGRSDPLLALSTQRNKHTLPDPQSFSKMLTRSKLGRMPKDAGWKVIHNELPLTYTPKVISVGGDSQGDHGPVVLPNDDGHKEIVSDQPDNSSVSSSYYMPAATREKSKTSVPEKSSRSKQLPEIPAQRSEADIHVTTGKVHPQNISQSTTNASTEEMKRPAKNNSAIVTEKLSSGCVFSPIHPPPVTVAEEKSVREPIDSPSILFQPTPISASSLDTSVGTQNAEQEAINAASHDAKMQLVAAHEDQLATITSLCKYEMRLLLSAKKVMGKRGFDDYLRRVNDILHQKMSAIAVLHEQITQYRSNRIQSNHVGASIAASVSDSGTSLASNISLVQKKNYA